MTRKQIFIGELLLTYILVWMGMNFGLFTAVYFTPSLDRFWSAHTDLKFLVIIVSNLCLLLLTLWVGIVAGKGLNRRS